MGVAWGGFRQALLLAIYFAGADAEESGGARDIAVAEVNRPFDGVLLHLPERHDLLLAGVEIGAGRGGGPHRRGRGRHGRRRGRPGLAAVVAALADRGGEHGGGHRVAVMHHHHIADDIL
jgi:hypothetical protein